MKTHWKHLALTLVIGWFLGAASGLLIMHFCDHGKHARMRQHFYKTLMLTPEQKAQVDEILQASHQKLDQIFIETRPKVEDVQNATRAQIRQLLTPQQKAIFDRLQAKYQERFEKNFEHLGEKLHG